MAGYGECSGCGAALDESEMFRGELCDSCRREDDPDLRDSWSAFYSLNPLERA